MCFALDGGVWLHRHKIRDEPMVHLVSSDKGRLLALVVPDDFDIERFAADAQSLAKGFAPRNDPPRYLIRLIRQIEAALLTRSRSGIDRAGELKRWSYAVSDYEIVR